MPYLANPPALFFGKYCKRAPCNLLDLLCTLSASIPGATRYFRRSLHVREGRKEIFILASIHNTR